MNDATEEWDYNKSVEKVQNLFVKWKTISTEFLQLLWEAKQAITKDGTRISGRPKEGEISWDRFIKDCFGEKGPTKKTIDSYLDRYKKAGFVKDVISDDDETINHEDDEKNETHDDNDKAIISEEVDDDDDDDDSSTSKIAPITPISDSTKYQIINVEKNGHWLKFDIFLPDYNKTYTRTISLKG